MRKISLALACASMGLVGSVHAASSASATIGNLTFRVIDLNPFDGIDASYSFLATSPYTGSTSLSVTASDNGSSDSASKTRNQAFYTKSLSTEDLDHAGASASVSTSSLSASGYATGPSTSFSAQANTGASYGYYGGALSLTANSILIVTAEASVNAKASNGSSSYYCYYCDSANASASFSMSYNYSSGSTYTYYSYNDSVSAYATSNAGYYNWTYDYLTGTWSQVFVPGGDQDNSNSRSFSAVFTNSSNVTQYASLSLGTSVNGYGTSDIAVAGPSGFPMGGPTAAVPEADAMAMAAAGLGVAALLRRRRRTA